MDQILRTVFASRRTAGNLTDPCTTAPCEQCFAPHRTKVEQFLSEGEPLHFVLPAFPAKSANRSKTLGPLPDLAERLSLEFLQRLCDHLRG
ncbi:MAG TPA: L-tyrosine/L-tryptophan isonitrile synthase family protein [Kineosporiaceae bacterium]